MNENTGEILKKLRKEHGLTQQDVSGLLGIDRTTYTFYETGKTVPSLSTVKKLARMYSCSVDYLVYGEEYSRDAARGVRVAASNAQSSEHVKDEQLFLMYFRLIPEEKREEALKLLKELAE